MSPTEALIDRSPVAAPTGDRTPERRTGTAQLVSWLGVLAVGAGALWLGAVGLGTLLAAGDLGVALAASRSVMVGPALLAVVAALFLAERRWPAVRRPARSRAHLVDGAYLVLFAAAVVPLLTVVQDGFAIEVRRHAAFLLLGTVPVVPRLVVVVVVLVAMDGANWVAHLANHRSTALWRLHALHHSQEDMSVLTTFRTHPLVHASYLGSVLPALVLAASGTVPAVALIAYGCLVTLPHANLRWTFGPLGKVLVSPAYHRLHHASEPAGPSPDGVVNFGFVLVCWDRLARRAAFPRPGAPVTTGIAGRPVPVEQAVAGPGGRLVLAQLAQPFRLRAATGGRW